MVLTGKWRAARRCRTPRSRTASGAKDLSGLGNAHKTVPIGRQSPTPYCQNMAPVDSAASRRVERAALAQGLPPTRVRHNASPGEAV